ncbi:cysteine hydrolase family protein [Agaribacter marinus]|uniref:Isochorismatase n=1 Tax=Agaribacter marinus TaxID=1431249 RepID=A0AA37SV80_9ALTE|nr:isochorismatase family cysteine hydrolase [Agaribacter marinus]GLR70033.1 isochorismatase [Agaribacter marinus]
MKPALLVIDVQKDSFKLNATAEHTLGRAMGLINLSMETFRNRKLPVVIVRHINEEQGFAPGNEDYEFPPSLAIDESDIYIQKRYGNAFNKTSLASTLKSLNVDTIFITGFCAEICVLSTYRGAEDEDLTPILIRGALGSGNLDNLAFVESIHNTLTYDATKAILAK